MKDEYEFNVFINCPFDEHYKELFEAIVFCVVACGFIPRCALEQDDSDDIRINKIIDLIENCKYGIHDLSRIETTNGMPRFNMPLELGLFIGCKRYGKQKDKKYLILDSESYRFKQFISDLGGQDIKSHNASAEKIILCVRDWLANKSRKRIPHASKLHEKYLSFRQELPNICNKSEWTVNELTFLEYTELSTVWLREQEGMND